MTKVRFPQAGHDFYKSNGEDPVLLTVGPSLTRQEFLEESDINSLMKRYETYGTSVNGLRPDAERQVFYADFTEMPNNLLDYLSMVKQAETAFMTLPAGVRREFDNDPVGFVDFASNPDNLDQMRAWGLAPPAKAPEGAAESVAALAVVVPPGEIKSPGGASTHGST
ncbi:MAG: internal scaffolding protein [Microvirus sp.]|nr:MAG: internal scaffolding protein [Microvirus sp.]